MTKKTWLIISLAASLIPSAWAQSVTPREMQYMNLMAHKIERGLKSSDQRSVCEDIGRLSGLSDELVVYRGSPDRSTQETLQRLIDLNNSATKLQILCEKTPANARAQRKFLRQTMSVLQNGVFPILQRLEPKYQTGRRISLNR